MDVFVSISNTRKHQSYCMQYYYILANKVILVNRFVDYLEIQTEKGLIMFNIVYVYVWWHHIGIFDISDFLLI